jgi:pimeloyl-ACP methyl ester carboxylesterase
MKGPPNLGGPLHFWVGEFDQMQRRVGQVVAESIAAESAKFTASMLLIPGFWCAASVWRRFMGYLAHRGWACHALSLRGPAEAGRGGAIGAVQFADYADDVRKVIDSCEAPPVVVGHDLGGLLALACGSSARAVVALAPVVPRAIAATAHPALTGMGARVAMLRSGPLVAPRGRVAAAYFGGGAPGGIRSDSGRVARELASSAFRLPPTCALPALVLAGERDAFCPPDAVEHLARHYGATFRSVEGASHAMPWEPGWERRVSEIHRWLIQTLGEPLLLPRDEEDEVPCGGDD